MNLAIKENEGETIFYWWGLTIGLLYGTFALGYIPSVGIGWFLGIIFWETCCIKRNHKSNLMNESINHIPIG